MTSGYLYALANQSMPGVFKIGCTSRNPFERAKELRTTGVPTAFFVVAAVYVAAMKKAEAQAHAQLGAQGQRVDGDREFFRTTPPEIMRTFSQLVDDLTETTSEASPDHQAVLANAMIYHFGHQETPPDLKKAIVLYEQAVHLGSSEAAGTLARLYAGGKGVRKSPEKARYYRLRELYLLDKENIPETRWPHYVARADRELRSMLLKKEYTRAWNSVVREADLEGLILILPFVSKDTEGAARKALIDALGDLPNREDPETLMAKTWVQKQLLRHLSTAVIPEVIFDSLYSIWSSNRNPYAVIEINRYRALLALCKQVDPDETTGLPYEQLVSLTEEQLCHFPRLWGDPVTTINEQLHALSI
jgi:hypothetical protein